MIVFRYLSRQILQIAAVVTFVLLFVVLTGRFVQYLAEAVAGKKRLMFWFCSCCTGFLSSCS